MKIFIESLDEHQRAGLDFTAEYVEKSETKTQTGVKTVLIRRREYKYTLTLQDLTNTQVKFLISLLETKENTRPYTKLTIPTNLFTGYIGKGSGDITFNFDSNEANWTEEEEGFKMILPVQEIEVI